LHLRYLLSGAFPGNEENGCVIDETGYLFFPAQYDYSFDRYMREFSARSRKKLTRELDSIETRGSRYRFNHFPDVEKLFQMNLDSFKEKSYFYDRRFMRSFETLADWLRLQGMLHITTLLIEGEIAAVDIGAVWKSQYTVLAGGTNPEFPGVAKIINFQHLEWACLQRFALVDFLCGDFGWKSRFHLHPRPLYLIDTSANTKTDNKLV
jgi:CelD/BcsL family acetyltransferase involved in cellulose biosynthesis